MLRDVPEVPMSDAIKTEIRVVDEATESADQFLIIWLLSLLGMFSRRHRFFRRKQTLVIEDSFDKC
jgi:hypothetical protein